MADRLWYFAYGSNMCRAIFVERRGMRPSATTWGWLDGWRLCFDLPVGSGERGVASVEPAAGEQTCGVLYHITAPEADHLDRTEGVSAGIYRRVDVRVARADGAVLEAFTYRSSYSSPGRKPSPRYIGLLLDGVREHGLPAGYADFLRGFALARDERPEYGGG